MKELKEYKDRDYTNIKEIFDLKIVGLEKLFESRIQPIYKLLEKHDETLYSKTGDGGLQKDSNDIKNSIFLFKWFVGISSGIVVAKEFIKKIIG